MKKRSDDNDQREILRQRIIGLGEKSLRKSYYPELQKRLTELENFRQLLDRIKDAIYLFEVRTGRITDANQSACGLLRLPLEKLLRLTVLDIDPTLTSEKIENFGKPKDGSAGPKSMIISHFLRADDSEVPVEVTIHVPSRPADSLGIIVARDISDRLASEKALQESERRYRLLVENAPLGIISIDRGGNVMDFNSKVIEILGFNRKAFPFGINMLNHPRFVQSGISRDMKECLDHGTATDGERLYIDQFKKKVFLRYHLTPIRGYEKKVTGLQAVFEDISERKNLEAQLSQSKKLEAIGTLAGGIAHDFNNILAAIVGYTEMSLLEAPTRSQIPRRLKRVLISCQRAKDLINQILVFSRQGEGERKSIDLREVISDCLKLLRASLPATIELEKKMESQGSCIFGDRAQISQMFLNISANAAHSMREKGGKLSVAISNVILDKQEAGFYLGLLPGAYAKLSVRDTGHGMSRSTYERIFEPFFSTKKPGEGTGMGLSVAHGIVKSHGGAIRVHSEPGEGSEFVILLPLERRGLESQTGRQSLLPKGKERILFVDDEPFVADAIRENLESLGYEVRMETSPKEALEVFEKDPDSFDLIITDQTMPEIPGDRLTERIHGIRREIPVILCTGFSEKIDDKRASELGIQSLLLKPLVITELAKTVRETLDRNNLSVKA